MLSSDPSLTLNQSTADLLISTLGNKTNTSVFPICQNIHLYSGIQLNIKRGNDPCRTPFTFLHSGMWIIYSFPTTDVAWLLVRSPEAQRWPVRTLLLHLSQSFFKGTSQVSSPKRCMRSGTILTGYITLFPLVCVCMCVRACLNSIWQMRIPFMTASLSFSVSWSPSSITNRPFVLYGASLSPSASPHLPPSLHLSGCFLSSYNKNEIGQNSKQSRL